MVNNCHRTHIEKDDMQSSEVNRPSRISLPPLYTWPYSLKLVILIGAYVVCGGAYAFLLIGVVGLAITLFTLL